MWRVNRRIVGAVAWRAAVLTPFLLLARGDFVRSELPGTGVQAGLSGGEPWAAIWLTPHIALHLALFDDVVLGAIATGLALLWALMRPAADPAGRRRPAGGLPAVLALLGPGAGCG